MIKQPIFAVISAVLLAVVFYFVVDRLFFLKNAKHTQGVVINVTAQNGSCGGGKRRRSYSCTRFNAQISFSSELGEQGLLNLSAGSERGHNQSVSLANYRMNQPVPVVYDPKNLSTAYHDSFFGVWGAPIMTFVMQIVTFIGSICEPKRRRY